MGHLVTLAVGPSRRPSNGSTNSCGNALTSDDTRSSLDPLDPLDPLELDFDTSLDLDASLAWTYFTVFQGASNGGRHFLRTRRSNRHIVPLSGTFDRLFTQGRKFAHR